MSTPFRVGQTLPLHAAADDPTGVLDPNAVDTWEEVDANGAAATSGLITLTGNGPDAGALGVAAGATFVAASASDPDGNKVSSPPFPLLVLAATDAASVTITAGTPA